MTDRCEDAPCCGHVECGFGPGVPGYGSMVGGVPYYGEPRSVRMIEPPEGSDLVIYELVDPHATAFAVCSHCGEPFEDLAVAIAENGGWCPRCDKPARADTSEETP